MARIDAASSADTRPSIFDWSRSSTAYPSAVVADGLAEMIAPRTSMTRVASVAVWTSERISSSLCSAWIRSSDSRRSSSRQAIVSPVMPATSRAMPIRTPTAGSGPIASCAATTATQIAGRRMAKRVPIRVQGTNQATSPQTARIAAVAMTAGVIGASGAVTGAPTSVAAPATIIRTAHICGADVPRGIHLVVYIGDRAGRCLRRLFVIGDRPRQ